MTSVISGLTSAVGGLLPSFLGGKDDALRNDGNLGGRSISHWSINTLRVAAAAGVIAAIVAAVVGNYVLAITFAALGVTNFIGSWYISQFLPLSSIEDTIDDMASTLEKLSFYGSKLDRAEDRLSDTVQIQSQNLGRYRAVMAKAQRLAGAMTEIVGKITAGERQRQVLEAREEKLLEQTQHMTETLDRIHQQMLDREKGLTSHGEFMDNLRRELAEQQLEWLEALRDFDDENRELLQHLDRHDLITNDFKRHVDSARDQMEGHREDLTAEVAALRQVQAQRAALQTRAEDITEDLEVLAQRRKENREYIEALLTRVNTLMNQHSTRGNHA